MTERDLFIAALQKEDLARRRAYLDEACARQPELRRQVENLLRLHEAAGSFLEKPAAESAATETFPDAAERAASGEAPVSQAVQHAHHKGVIHRDLKPSNVLVALYDGRPVPKVIDFGVAKAAGPTLTEKTLVTSFGAIVGTLEYMSPEQAEINQLDVDTRSDVYSLGVLLYELLTGSPPFTRKELEKAGVLEMLRVIREQEPTKPSAKLSTAEGLPTLATNRGTEPAKLTKIVRGELDWIVMKALEKDRNRRYETANGFAMDVRRYLADEPVLACPPSAGYRLRKLLRRHRGPVLAAALVLLALVAGIVGTTLGLVEARRQRDLTEQA